jgi:exopolysaccharide biosynthesis polyprenyl glycosylphosphotransferase
MSQLVDLEVEAKQPGRAVVPAAPRRDVAVGRAGRIAAALFGRHWVLLRLGLDVVLLVLGVLAAHLGAAHAGVEAGRVHVWLMVPVVLALFAARGGYRRSLQVDVGEALLRVLSATSLAAMAILAYEAVIQADTRPALLVARAWAFATLYMAGGQLLVAAVERKARVSGAMTKPTLVVGAGVVGTQIERRLAEQPELGLRVVGFLDADPLPPERVPDRRAPVLGAPEEFARIADAMGIRHVVVTFTSTPDSMLTPLVRACHERDIEISLIPRMFESVNLRVQLENVGPLPLFHMHWVDPKGWQFAAKHALDRIGSLLILACLLPLLLLITVAVRLDSPGPILFRQRRIGRDGQRFVMFKFRSMRIEGAPGTAAPAPGVAPGGVEGEDRRTALGRFLRRTSLDELPQLLNVLRGEMSLVGPRPERPEFVELFDEQVRRYQDRHRVKSGITGLAQVHGLRGKTSLTDRIELDNYYIQNWSLGLDLRILAKTLVAAFRSPGE